MYHNFVPTCTAPGLPLAGTASAEALQCACTHYTGPASRAPCLATRWLPSAGSHLRRCLLVHVPEQRDFCRLSSHETTVWHLENVLKYLEGLDARVPYVIVPFNFLTAPGKSDTYQCESNCADKASWLL